MNAIPNKFECNGKTFDGNANVANAFNHYLQILALI